MKKTAKEIFIFFILIWSSFQLYAGDGIITHLSIQKYMKTSTNISITGWVQNNAGSNIVSFKTGWSLDNGANNISSTINIGGAGLPTGLSYMPFTHPTPLNVSSVGQHILKIWVQATGETNFSNDTITYYFTALSSYANKVNLFEEYTATWCSSCPAGNSATASIAALPDAAVARFHNGDAYSCSDGEAYYEAYFSGSIYTPSGIINMGESGGYDVNSITSIWLGEMTARSGNISPLEITLTPNLNTASRQLTVDLKAKFKYAENGDYYMNVYILENGIVGTQSGVSGAFTHDLVVRSMLGGSTGTPGIIPASPIVNTDYTKSYNYTIPTAWNLNKLVLIGLVFEKNGGTANVLNAVKYSYDNSGIEPVLTSSDILIMYPNPASDKLNVLLPENSELEIYSNEGQLLKSFVIKENNTSIDISGFAKGMYFMKVKTDKGIVIKKFIKE